jgi:hypothetical protein
MPDQMISSLDLRFSKIARSGCEGDHHHSHAVITITQPRQLQVIDTAALRAGTYDAIAFVEVVGETNICCMPEASVTNLDLKKFKEMGGLSIFLPPPGK